VERPIYRFLHLVFALGSLHLLVLLGLEVKRSLEVSHQIQSHRQEVLRLEQKVKSLQQIVNVAHTESYREALARRLGYVHKTEVLYTHAQLKGRQ
jgi:hypothetical protein